jgi:hypothetical protein
MSPNAMLEENSGKRLRGEVGTNEGIPESFHRADERRMLGRIPERAVPSKVNGPNLDGTRVSCLCLDVVRKS